MKRRRSPGYALVLLLGLGLGAAGGARGVHFDAQALSGLGGLGDVGGLGEMAQTLWNAAPSFELPELRLKRVEFVGLAALRPGPLLARAGLDGTRLLSDVDTTAVCEAIARHPRVRSCTAMRLPPDRLLIGVHERAPVAVDRAGVGLDAEGARFPLRDHERRQLPRVHGDIEAALGLLVAALDAGVAVERVDAHAPRDISFQPEGRALRVRVGREPERELRDWTRLRESGLLELHTPREVDMRFRGSAVLRGTDTEGGKRQWRGMRD